MPKEIRSIDDVKNVSKVEADEWVRKLRSFQRRTGYIPDAKKVLVRSGRYKGQYNLKFTYRLTEKKKKEMKTWETYHY